MLPPAATSCIFEDNQQVTSAIAALVYTLQHWPSQFDTLAPRYAALVAVGCRSVRIAQSKVALCIYDFQMSVHEYFGVCLTTLHTTEQSNMRMHISMKT